MDEMDDYEFVEPTEEEEWEEEYGDIVGVGTEGIGARMHAARLVAGIVMSIDAARRLDVHPVTYRHAETGYRPTDEQMMAAAAQLYSVDPAYLLDGIANTERTRLADRLVAIFPQTELDVDEPETDVDYDILMRRLTEMRVAMGHESPAAAAGAHGWNRYTFWQHEAGTRNLSLDRMIGYALAMGVRPEWAILGQGDLKEPNPFDWQEVERLRRGKGVGAPSLG